MKGKLKPKIKFRCSECGKVHYRVLKGWYPPTSLYCTVCQEQTLVENKK